MIKLFEAVQLGRMAHESPILRITVSEDDYAGTTVDKCHGAHETRFDVCQNYELFEVVKFILFACLTLNGEATSFGSQHHYRVVDNSF